MGPVTLCSSTCKVILVIWLCSYGLFHFVNLCLSVWFLWRPRTVYRSVQRTRSVSVKVIYCCTGWRKAYSSSRECTEGNLYGIHYTWLLMLSPILWKMSAKINNDNTFFYFGWALSITVWILRLVTSQKHSSSWYMLLIKPKLHLCFKAFSLLTLAIVAKLI